MGAGVLRLAREHPVLLDSRGGPSFGPAAEPSVLGSDGGMVATRRSYHGAVSAWITLLRRGAPIAAWINAAKGLLLCSLLIVVIAVPKAA